jgi:tRNA threonylcarbamoyladenosine biosynthesis protein TsaB
MMQSPEFSQHVVGLAFETSTALSSVALGRGESVLDVEHLGGPRRHAVDFLPAVDALCRTNAVEPSDVRRVYVSCGPGSFTGLRIGITAARMLAIACGAELVAVPTLEVVAQNALDSGPPCRRVAVLLDAKRGRVYAAAFRRRAGSYVPATKPLEVDPTQFLAEQRLLDASCAVLGEGVPYHHQAVAGSGLMMLPEALYPPRVETVYRLGVRRAEKGCLVDRRTLTPLYVRPPEAEEKWRERHGLS